MANVENVVEMVGTRKAEAAAVATESGGAATTGDEAVATAGDETAATCGVMYANEGPYTIDVRHVEEMVGTTREAADGDRVRRGRDGDETGSSRDETHGHVMQHIIKILFYFIEILFTNRFSQFLLQKIQQ